MRPGALIKAILIATVLFWGGIACCCLVGCSDNPQKRAVEVAKTALTASVDNPESVQIKGISKVDSVFGREYVTMNEQMALSMTLMKLGQEVMKEDCMESIDPKNWEFSERVKQRMEAMTALRELVSMGMLESGKSDTGKAKPFNGWKVKIEFEAKATDGSPYRSEYWFILDKEASCVVKSFEIPLAMK